MTKNTKSKIILYKVKPIKNIFLIQYFKLLLQLHVYLCPSWLFLVTFPWFFVSSKLLFFIFYIYVIFSIFKFFFTFFNRNKCKFSLSSVLCGLKHCYYYILC
ncbi:hypothetical protein EDEG_04080 [Edhazardia aedis USNM 41457]|uniref:Uncharacterized protein n=1 Tax=Edhazardia aedis (strain USNM 41457) TaxID=1003232 RepID=J9DCV5_EDHAE|nr:hypothetical protein EDEG_04080 [Edhazardia aedis USNM 41457]|eukprot:EJW05299.1 hypothetical protein EDEG_04080 [Edhazardia aedis USNM 41457]